MNTLEVLTAGRALIAKSWSQGSWSGDDEKSQCSAGAINRVVFGQVELPNDSSLDHDKNGPKYEYKESTAQYPEWANSMRYLGNAVRLEEGRKLRKPTARLGALIEDIIGFNDGDDQSQAGVLAAFDRAIRNAKRRHPRG